MRRIVQHTVELRGLAIGVVAALLWIHPAAIAAETTITGGESSAAATSTNDSAAVSAPATPQLSIALDNGHTSVVSGDTLEYTLTIQNLGAADIPGLLITQTVPTGLEFGSADSRGTVDGGNVHWTLDLKHAATDTVHTRMTVTATPPELLRLATVACASLAADGPPIVCAAHSDQLPAGAAAAVGSGATTTAPIGIGVTTAAISGSSSRTWWYVGGAVGLLIVAGVAAAFVLARRRARSRTS